MMDKLHHEVKMLIELAVSACRERDGEQMELQDLIHGIRVWRGLETNEKLEALDREIEALIAQIKLE
jgi:hypothetical protein